MHFNIEQEWQNSKKYATHTCNKFVCCKFNKFNLYNSKFIYLRFIILKKLTYSIKVLEFKQSYEFFFSFLRLCWSLDVQDKLGLQDQIHIESFIASQPQDSISSGKYSEVFCFSAFQNRHKREFLTPDLESVTKWTYTNMYAHVTAYVAYFIIKNYPEIK